MTALVVVRSGDLRRRIRITQADEAYLGCCIQGAGLNVGDVLTARQLLYAMLLPSGADAALALANSYGPGWRAFVGKMNANARRLHLVGTHFTNFDGVPSSDVSTPRNLLLLGEAAMRLPVFRAVVRQKRYLLRAGTASPSLLLAEHEPAARQLSRRDRDQDRLDPGGRRVPAVRGRAQRSGC